MAEAYIVEALRTAGGRRNGKLAGWHPADMTGEMLNAIVDRTKLDPAAIDDVIVGCVSQAGEQAFAFARNAVLASRLPTSVPAVTIDRQCKENRQSRFDQSENAGRSLVFLYLLSSGIAASTL